MRQAVREGVQKHRQAYGQAHDVASNRKKKEKEEQRRRTKLAPADVEEFFKVKCQAAFIARRGLGLTGLGRALSPSLSLGDDWRVGFL